MKEASYGLNVMTRLETTRATFHEAVEVWEIP